MERLIAENELNVLLAEYDAEVGDPKNAIDRLSKAMCASEHFPALPHDLIEESKSNEVLGIMRIRQMTKSIGASFNWLLPLR